MTHPPLTSRLSGDPAHPDADESRLQDDQIRDTAPSVTPDGSVFEVQGYSYADAVFLARFRGDAGSGPTEFHERIDFGAAASAVRPSETLLRLLTLATSLSYYKATRADAVSIGFPLSDAELAFFRAVTEHGLGEYAYVNDCAWKLTPTVTAAPAAPEPPRPVPASGNRPVVAVGGGKDSIVTIEALKDAGIDPLLYSVGDRGAIRSSVAASGCDYLTVSRVIDPLLIRANREGALNGHIPVTAINSIIGLVVAELTTGGPTIFSNEESADYGNLVWHGRTINHQWSKSLEYEDLLRTTLAAAGLPPDRFFSLLRGYREIEIAQAFARHPQYFDAFTSCNRAYRIAAEDRSASWCGECPKCTFVFLLLAPYIPRARLTSIFGRDLLAEPGQRERLEENLGLGAHKPFECVGEPAEAIEALVLADRSGQWHDAPLVDELAARVPAMTPAGSAPRDDRVPAGYRASRDLIGLS